MLPLVAGVQLSGSITLGAIILGVLVSLGTLSVLFYGARWRASSESLKAAYEGQAAVITSLSEGREAYKLRGERLDEEIRSERSLRERERVEQAELRNALKNELDSSNLKTDLTGAIEQWREQHSEQMAAITGVARDLIQTRQNATREIAEQLRIQDLRHAERLGELAETQREIAGTQHEIASVLSELKEALKRMGANGHLADD